MTSNANPMRYSGEVGVITKRIRKDIAMIERRALLKGVALGAGSVVFSPLIRSFAAQAEGDYAHPKRVVFILFDNGFHETGAQPVGVPLGSDQTRELPLKPLVLPKDIDPFTPYKDRLTIVQGLRGAHLSPNHGAGFGALSGASGGLGENKFRRVVAESIDAAIARSMPGIFPLLVLGVDPGNPETTTYYASSAWGPGRAIAAQCRPELAYESLFGSMGADRNDFVTRKNLLDFVADDVKRLRPQLTGAEREQLDYHLGALESLSQREDRLSKMQADGRLKKHSPKIPLPPPQLMPDVLAAQFDIAASALMTGLTNVVTITSGLCRIRGSYSGFSQMGVHTAGHNKKDPQQGIMGHQVLSKVRRYIAEQTVALMKKLESIPEGKGSMLDNTLLVFTSDSANRQHTSGENWPFVLLGNLGGRLKTGRYVAYPMTERGAKGEWSYHGSAAPSNPTINALYCTLLHAVGAPRKHFNLTGANKENPDQHGPLSELLS